MASSYLSRLSTVFTRTPITRAPTTSTSSSSDRTFSRDVSDVIAQNPRVLYLQKKGDSTQAFHGDTYDSGLKKLSSPDARKIEERVIKHLNSVPYDGDIGAGYQNENVKYFEALNRCECPVSFEIDVQHSMQMACCKHSVSSQYCVNPSVNLTIERVKPADKKGEFMMPISEYMFCPVCRIRAPASPLNVEQLSFLLEIAFKRRLVEPELDSAQFDPKTGKLLFNKGRFVMTVNSDQAARKMKPPTTLEPVRNLISTQKVLPSEPAEQGSLNKNPLEASPISRQSFRRGVPAYSTTPPSETSRKRTHGDIGHQRSVKPKRTYFNGMERFS